MSQPTRLLIINPNTTTAMTTALAPAIQHLSFPLSLLQTTYFTCPSSPSNPGIPSINSPADAAASAETCIPHLTPLLASHDAFLVACYSEHPLVKWLGGHVGAGRYVTGIFEASVAASLSLVAPQGDDVAFGIVSTGKVWEEALAGAVAGLLGSAASRRFLGCETTGLNADQLHRLPGEEVKGKMMEATKRLVDRGIAEGRPLGAVCLGCAGMVGLEEAVREALVQSLGEAQGRRVRIVDGVLAGVGGLVALARTGV